MSATVETAAVNAPNPDPTHPADTAHSPPAATRAHGASTRARPRGHRDRSSTLIAALITVLGALITVLGALLIWQLNAMNHNIDSLSRDLRNEISGVETSLRNEISGVETSLRAEMQAGFREVNATLLDHTDRLARLEAASALASPTSPNPPGSAHTLPQ
ncbi:hypothetical protein [Candidatus Poriferisodalis sp.]|uniref:hypothetical protein n=1 Tax=Candidatus Poriferisodalis sp. TaxID=3101277 RepID=UPI003B01F166